MWGKKKLWRANHFGEALSLTKLDFPDTVFFRVLHILKYIVSQPERSTS